MIKKIDWILVHGAVAIGLVLLMLFSGCAPKRVVTGYPKAAVVKSGYTTQEISPDVFIVYVIPMYFDNIDVTPRSNGETQAKEDICSVSFVCTWQPGGKVFVVARTRK